MQVIRITIASVLALGLMLGVTLPALAASETAPVRACDFPYEIVKGTVSDIGDGYFVIQSNGDELTINVDESTGYFEPPIPEQIRSSCQNFMQFRNQVREKVEGFGQRGMGFGNQDRLRSRNLDREQLRLRIQTSRTDDTPFNGLNQMRRQCPFAGESGFSDIEVGDRVVAVLADGADGDYLAERVVIFSPLGD